MQASYLNKLTGIHTHTQ